MALNVISNYAANVAQRYLQQSDSEATRSVAKLSAGTRVLSARDDAASMAISTSIRSDIAGLKQAAVNAGQASSMLQIADGAMGTVTDILVRAKSLAIQSSSDQLTDNQRAMVGKEFEALQDEMDRISKGTRFDGQTLLAGSGAAGISSVRSASVSSGNAVNKGAAYAFEFNENNLMYGNATIDMSANTFAAGLVDATKFSFTIDGATQLVTLASAATTSTDLATKLQTALRLVNSAAYTNATVTSSGGTSTNAGTLTINLNKADSAMSAVSITKNDGATGVTGSLVKQAFNLVTAKVGGTDMNFELTQANSDTVAKVASSLNADAIFSQYFIASTETIPQASGAAKSRLYLTALTNDPLTSFSIKSRETTGGSALDIKGGKAVDIKVGQSTTFDLSADKIAGKDSLSFTLGGTASTVNLDDVRRWASEVSNAPAASGVADNTVAAAKQRTEFDLSGLLTTTADVLTVQIDAAAAVNVAKVAGASVADTIDAFVTANTTLGGAKTSREGNKLVLTATTAGTAFTVVTVNAQKAGATATEVAGVTTQASRTQAAVGFTDDGRLVRKNTTSVQSANTDVQLTTKEALTFLAAYINDSSSAPHTLGQSVIASVSPDSRLVLTTKGGTVGSQAAFSAGGYSMSTGSSAFEVNFQIGARSDGNERLKVRIANVGTANLGIDKVAAGVGTSVKAQAAIGLLNTALDRMANFRADIGAQQNRLDFASNNLAITMENSEAARSNLMDLDVAAEMSYFTSRQILSQAGVSMLAQANQMPQNLLRLFR